MLKVFHKTLLIAFVLGACIPQNQSSVSFALNEAPKIVYNKTEIKRVNSIADVETYVDLINEKMIDVLKVENIQPTGSKTIHDFAGNEFIVTRYGERGYGILNVANEDVVEIAPLSALPFDWNVDDVRYIPWVGFYELRNGSYVNTSTGKELSSSDLALLKTESAEFIDQSIDDKNEYLSKQGTAVKKTKSVKTASDDVINYPLESGLIYADVEVPYSWFFKRNATQYPYNFGGYCGYVAASMLLEYNEIFNSTGYFSKAEANKYIKPYVGTMTNDGWDGVPELIDSFPKDIWGDNIGSSVPSVINSAIHKFMSGKDKEYDIYNYVWKFSTVTDPIRQGVPAAYFGNIKDPKGDGDDSDGHVVVAYGYYNDGKLLVHYGWDNRSQVIMSQLGFISLGGVIGIYNKSSHKHNKYFGDKATRKNYCGCGALMEC